MSNNIDDKIAQLPPEERANFQDRLWIVANHKSWLEQNGINPTDPDIQQVKQVLYNLEYAQFAPKPKQNIDIEGYGDSFSTTLQESPSQ